MPGASFFDCAILICARSFKANVSRYGLPLAIKSFDIHFTDHIVNRPVDTKFSASDGFVTPEAQALFDNAQISIHKESSTYRPSMRM